MIKKWKIHKADSEKVKLLSEQGGLSEIAAEILSAAGFDDFDSAKGFFGNSKLSDPFSIIDMQAACDAIEDIVFENGDRVCVYGDYDCDGICATTILYTFLLTNGADVTYHINSRAEGFGLNSDVIKQLAKDDVKLIITVDNGIAAIKEAELIKKLGMELIVTDHHIPGEELPKAIAVVDPHRVDNTSDFKDYCGAGVALMLVAALMGDVSAATEEFSDIAALATVADVMPLFGDNRNLVRLGLRYLEHTENPGLIELIRVCGKNVNPPFNADHIGWYMAPRINTANRVAHPKIAFELLLCEDPQKAAEIADNLNELNSKRQQQNDKLMEEIWEGIKDEPNILYEPVICIHVPNANHGLVGLAAGKITESTGKPCFLCTDDEDGILRGSVRSKMGFDVKKAMDYSSNLLTKYGGHPRAGGFSLKRENFQALKNALLEYSKSIPEYDNVPVLNIVKVMEQSSLTLENIREIENLEPFGEGFERPLFLLPSAVITGIGPTKTGNYNSLSFKYENIFYTTTAFKFPLEHFGYAVGDHVDIVTYISIGTWNSKGETIDFDIQDIRLSGLSQAKLFCAYSYYEKFRLGEELSPEMKKSVLPSQTECKAINDQIQKIGERFTISQLIERNASVMNGFKLRIVLDTFEEAGRIEIDRVKDTLKILKPTEVIRITSTPTMKRLL